MMHLQVWGVAFLVFVAIAYILKRKLALRNMLPLPPGPKGLPIVGNYYDRPGSDDNEYEYWSKHKDLYGPISSVTVFGKTYIIINEVSIAYDLLRDRAQIHSSRPYATFLQSMCEWKYITGFLPYNQMLKKHRKNITQVVGSKVSVAKFERLQEAQASHFLVNLLERPEGLLDHVRSEAAGVILSVIFGYNTRRESDPLAKLSELVVTQAIDGGMPGKYLVDILPFLQYLPSWLPGMGFKHTARTYAVDLRHALNQPYQFVLAEMREKRAKKSYMSEAINFFGTDIEAERNHKWSALSMFLGGADTTVSSIQNFFLAMMCFPEVQKKAQEEIDRVIGKDRLPHSADLENLPYIEAVVKETYRWHSIVPIGLPHESIAEDIYRGYRIPKGSIIIQNIWMFCHDPNVYSSPHTFNPDRHIATPTRPAEPDPRTMVFGFGRRVCPGRFIADNALIITIAQTLAVFNIQKPVVDGKVIEPKVQFTPGLISKPVPFRASITPRNARCEELIRESEQVYPWEDNDADVLMGVKW